MSDSKGPDLAERRALEAKSKEQLKRLVQEHERHREAIDVELERIKSTESDRPAQYYGALKRCEKLKRDAAITSRKLRKLVDPASETESVYLLRSVNHAGTVRETYMGVTSRTIEKRLREHNAGDSTYTATYCPFEVALWIENLEEGVLFERIVKGLAHYKNYDPNAFPLWLAAHLSTANLPNQKLTYTQSKAFRIFYHLQYMRWKGTRPLILNLAWDLPESALPSFPDHVEFRFLPCPWATNAPQAALPPTSPRTVAPVAVQPLPTETNDAAKIASIKTTTSKSSVISIAGPPALTISSTATLARSTVISSGPPVVEPKSAVGQKRKAPAFSLQECLDMLETTKRVNPNPPPN
jgi:predicted GIY-YIG superfamily endonuclease